MPAIYFPLIVAEPLINPAIEQLSIGITHGELIHSGGHTDIEVTARGPEEEGCFGYEVIVTEGLSHHLNEKAPSSRRGALSLHAGQLVESPHLALAQCCTTTLSSPLTQGHMAKSPSCQAQSQ